MHMFKIPMKRLNIKCNSLTPHRELLKILLVAFLHFLIVCLFFDLSTLDIIYLILTMIDEKLANFCYHSHLPVSCYSNYLYWLPLTVSSKVIFVALYFFLLQ